MPYNYKGQANGLAIEIFYMSKINLCTMIVKKNTDINYLFPIEANERVIFRLSERDFTKIYNRSTRYKYDFAIYLPMKNERWNYCTHLIYNFDDYRIIENGIRDLIESFKKIEEAQLNQNRSNQKLKREIEHLGKTSEVEIPKSNYDMFLKEHEQKALFTKEVAEFDANLPKEFIEIFGLVLERSRLISKGSFSGQGFSKEGYECAINRIISIDDRLRELITINSNGERND